jgi:hypothetical protein
LQPQVFQNAPISCSTRISNRVGVWASLLAGFARMSGQEHKRKFAIFCGFAHRM